MRASRDGLARATDLALRGWFDAALASLPARSSEGNAWVRAYVAASRGELALALRLAVPLAESARARPVRVAASITAASVFRQRDKHAEAEWWDRTAFAAAGTEIETAHALIGLAADAIGRGRTVQCTNRLRDVHALGLDEEWRVQVRLDWVRVELALTTGRADFGIEAGRRAVKRSRDADARRHLAKSRLFYGVALADAGFPRAARRELHAAMHGASVCGAARVAQIARAVLAQKGFADAG